MIAVLIAVYGAICSYRADIFSYMFFKVEFTFPDYDSTPNRVNPYSADYNTVLDEAQREQSEQARPELVGILE